MLAEHEGTSGAVIREYIWLGDTVIAMVDGMASAPAYSFVHTGHLAEPLLVTDAAGAVVSSITRDPWGNAVLLAGTAAIRLGYPGQWHDGTSGLYQNWYRDYDPTLGRYMETDPIGLAGGTNLYAYVDGNPVNAVDPRGLDRIFVDYPSMPVDTGLGFNAPLGHSGVAGVDPLTHRVYYYDFGRYDKARCGKVRGPFYLGVLKYLPNGDPDPRSLSEILSVASRRYGKGSPARHFFNHNSYSGLVEYAEYRKESADDCTIPYELLFNNCKDFALGGFLY
ncbi:MAG: RHS repeat-associated core domain-containing protein [Novosphingobium sp.]